MSDVEDRASDDGDDLFGDVASNDGLDSPRAESDAVLEESGGEARGRERDDEENRYDSEEEYDRHYSEREKVIMGLQLFRHQTPRSTDGTLQSLKVPSFVKFFPEAYRKDTWEPSEWDIENAKSEKPKAVIRFYEDPETGELRSNALMHQWSDGSTTMTIGDQQYLIQKKQTAPPQDKYNELHDGHSYAAAAHLTSSLFAVVGHVNEEYTVRLDKGGEDEALQRLAMRMREATGAQDAGRIIKTTVDPELQRKQAEMAEKERMKIQRRRDNEAARRDRAPGFSRSAAASGLSIDDLEGPARPKSGTKRSAPGSGSRAPRRRQADSDSDEEDPRAARRGDEYDMEDDFVVASGDEEEEEVEEDDDEEDILDDAPPRHARTKRRRAIESDEDGDGDSE